MSYTLTLNSSNVVGSGNNTYKFNFIAGGFNAKDCEIAIGSLSIPYSWFNVSSSYSNNQFSLVIPTSPLVQNGSLTALSILQNGFYQVSDINQTIQLYLYNSGYYLINTLGQIVYYISIATNSTYYNVNIIFTAVPTTLPTGWSLPPASVGGWCFGLPTQSKTMQLIIPTNGIGAILGLTPGTYPTVTGATTTVSSNITPIGSSVNALLCHCSLLNNNLAVPSDILDLIPINSTFGSNINYQPPFSKFVKVRDGGYSSMSITFTDQNNNTLYANDPNIAMTLIIRQKDTVYNTNK